MKPGKMGVLSAVLASICCLGPVVLVLLGLGTLGIGALLGRYHWFFIGGAALVLIYAWRVYAKEKRRCDAASCQMESKASARITLLIATIAVLLFAGLNFYTYVIARAPEAKAAQPQEATVTIPVEGMVCFTCGLTVEASLKNMVGVHKAEASVKDHSVTLTYDPQRVKVEQMVAAINRTGYRAQLPAK